MKSGPRRIALVAAAAVALLPCMAAPAAADEMVTITSGTVVVQRDDRSTPIDERRFTTVSGQAVCEDRGIAFIRVPVTQRRTTGGNSVDIGCDGPSTWSVTVQTDGAAPWRPGNAEAVARMFDRNGSELAAFRRIQLRLVDSPV